MTSITAGSACAKSRKKSDLKSLVKNLRIWITPYIKPRNLISIMIVKKVQSKKIQNSKDCTVWEYAIPSKLFSFATTLINGRYPDKGRVTNLECEEIYYVVSGSGIVHSENGDFEIEKGDLYFFEKAEKYWVEGKNLLLVLVNAPPWFVEQHKNID
jgi:mannose-6-phosphate isomerase-like protein (cupin superfamily)